MYLPRRGMMMPSLDVFLEYLEQILRGSWQFFLLAVGLLYMILLMVIARRIGQQAATRQLRRWLLLPSAILNFFDAATVEAAVLNLKDALGQAVDAAGAVVLLGDMQPGAEKYQLVAAEGTLRSNSDRELEELLPREPRIADFFIGSQQAVDVVQLASPAGTPAFLRCFPGLTGGGLLAVRVHLDAADGSQCPDAALLMFDLGETNLDAVTEKGLTEALKVFPRMLEKMTRRFAHADDIERALERSRERNRILKQMLSGYQHDLSHALANLEEGVLATRSEFESGPRLQDGGDFGGAGRQMLAALRLTSQVAASGTLLVEVAEGESPIADMRTWEPEQLYGEVLQPLLYLRQGARSDLAVGVEIEPDLPHIHADRAAFFRAASNIIHNAFKFTDEGGVKLFIHRMENGVSFSVSDTGIGIPEDDIPDLGKLHRRAANASGFPGTGLGVWTAKLLVEAMGGNLVIRSSAGLGTTVQLVFPPVVLPVDVEGGCCPGNRR